MGSVESDVGGVGEERARREDGKGHAKEERGRKGGGEGRGGGEAGTISEYRWRRRRGLQR